MTKLSISLWILLALAVIATAYLWLNRPKKVVVTAAVPDEFTAGGFSHVGFEDLLKLHVTPNGNIDYDRWHLVSESVSQLDAYLAAVSKYSPENAPDRFLSRNDELAYWMYGYNAYVIKSVLDHWPLASVTDVKAPIEAVKGLGFFHQLRFSFGGEYLSLLAVENTKIRTQYNDARIHFVLNCASESCPIARPELPTGNDLEKMLTQATVEFINDDANVFVDHEAQVVWLSMIFKWYEEDFIHDLRAAGKSFEGGLVAYLSGYADPTLAGELARSSAYEIQFRDYDWELNSKR